MSTPYRSGDLRSTPFALNVYLHEYDDYLDTEPFDAMPQRGVAETIKYSRNVIDRHTALDTWVRRWTHCGGRSTDQQIEDIHYVERLFLHCEEYVGYVTRLTALINQYYVL